MSGPMARHALMLIACLAGIVGIGTIFGGAMHGDLTAVLRGVPFALLGVWWAGRELGFSMIAHRVK